MNPAHTPLEVLLLGNSSISNSTTTTPPLNTPHSNPTYQNVLQCLSLLYPSSSSCNTSNNVNQTTATTSFPNNNNNNNYSIPPVNSNTSTSSSKTPQYTNLGSDFSNLTTSFHFPNSYTNPSSVLSHELVTSFDSLSHQIVVPNNSCMNTSTSSVTIEEEVIDEDGTKSFRKRKTSPLSFETQSLYVKTEGLKQSKSVNKFKRVKLCDNDELENEDKDVSKELDLAENQSSNDPFNSFFVLLKNHLNFCERMNKNLLRSTVVFDYTHSTSLCNASNVVRDMNSMSPPTDSDLTYPSSDSIPLEKLCLLYSMYLHMCQRKGLTSEAKIAYEKTRALLKQVFDRYDNYHVAFTYCILSIYHSSEGDDETGKFYLDLVDHYFTSQNKNTSGKTTNSSVSSHEQEMNKLIQYWIPTSELDRDFFLGKFKLAADITNEAGKLRRSVELRRLIKKYYIYGTNQPQVTHPEFKNLLEQKIDGTTFEGFLKMVDFTLEMATLSSKSYNLDVEQQFILIHGGKGYKHTAYAMILLEYLDFLSKHDSSFDSSSTITLSSINNQDPNVNNVLSRLYIEVDAFMKISYEEPEALGAIIPAYFSCFSIACQLDLNGRDMTQTEQLSKISRDLHVMQYMSKRYKKVKILYSSLMDALALKKEELTKEINSSS
ncbi:hypothetical protein C9374_008891 [Naegleria lovaniensis]|uniref:Uncharacterized protein n=1 Tax=Naegleria lovaniensis TaxID=51637 RepID=A0AA88GIG4_NAELO|nr:uncharacterized protein C9374_008891 [Naegleria lovaniensis]KAG2377806.1 hypothetical protein C9374_008891 [Naegleria lovaniensis]